MVAGGRDAALAQVVAHLLHRRPLGAVDDARLGPSLVDEGIQARQLLLGLAPLHRETQVGPVEARDRAGRVAQTQKAHDVAAHQIGGRGRERRHGRADGQLSDELADGEVRGAEVLTPLGHAVGLVHGDQREPRRTGELGEARIGQALGSHVHEVIGALGRRRSTSACCPGASVEFRYAPRMPASCTARTWSAMSDTSGLTTSAMPSMTTAGTW